MPKRISGLLFFIFHFSFFAFVNAQTGTWSAMKNLPPHSNYGVCLLMTNGTVICHNHTDGGYGRGWDRLTPDIHGSYINGTWDTIAPMHQDRLFFSSQILPNGQVYVAGGEYGAGTSAGEIYDPVANTWAMCGAIPKKWKIYDGNSEILYDGTILEGPQIGATPSYDCLIYNPSTNLYTSAPSSFYNHDEAEWLKLPDSSVLFVGIATPYSNRYIPQTGRWVNDDTVPGDLYDKYGEEAGCALMLPNGKAAFFGATPYNAIYTPSGDTNPGTWASTDSFPVINGTYVGQPDASGAMMVNGHILLAVSPIGTSANNEFLSPAYFLEYDYTTGQFTQVMSTIPGQGGDSIRKEPCYRTQMLDLPDGNVLVSISQTGGLTNQYYIYTPGGAPIPQGKPTLDNIIFDSCGFYKITGKLFNGISEGAAYGDDWQMSTNWPLVRLINGPNVYYAKTTNWNRIGAVQTGNLEDTAYFMLPSMPGGTYSVEVVVNGFASKPVSFNTFGVYISSQTNIVCNSVNSGSAIALAANGNPPYTYSWSPSGGTNATASNLSAGTYTVTAFSNGGGCPVSAVVTITQPPVLKVSTIFAISCTAANDARAAANASGGTTPYTYSWSGGKGTNATITGLSIGSYTVTATDICGDTAIASVNINTLFPLNVGIDSVTNLKCHGDSSGNAIAETGGGAPPYIFKWSSGATSVIARGLKAGIYTVTVSDSCGNSATAFATITQPSPITIVANSVPTAQASCIGAAWVNVSGGISPYTYLWTDGKGTKDSIYKLCQGRYCCRVTDANGCIDSACITITSTAGIGNSTPNLSRVVIYPNPNNGVFTIVENGKLKMENELNTIKVYNILGERVYNAMLKQVQHDDYQIDLRSQPNGVYFYRVITENGDLIGEGKLVIEK